MYDPKIGRWLSEDPAGLTVDANPYRYVGNSPTNYTDPSGMQEYVPTQQAVPSRTSGDWHFRDFVQRHPYPSPEEDEKQQIKNCAQKWFNNYKGPGFPAENCYDQARECYNAMPVNWQYWEMRGVQGWKFKGL